MNAPLQNLFGLIDARIEQLGGAGGRAAEPRRPAAEPDAAEAADAPRQQRPPGSREAEPNPGNRTRSRPRRHETMAAVDTVFEQLGSMTVLELVELKNKIEEEWGITAAAPVAVAAAGGGGGGEAAGGEDGVRRRPHRRRPAEDPGDQGRPRGHRPRPQGGQGSRRLGAQPVKEGVNQEEADTIKAQLEEAGASVEIK